MQTIDFMTDYTPASNPARQRMEEVRLAFRKMALELDNKVKPGAEKSAGMRKLLEAKDCFVRQAIADGRESQRG